MLRVGPGRRTACNRGIADAAFVAGMRPVAWHRYARGITVTGAGVSQWDDASGNAHPLLQSTDTNRPALQADGTILFDGVDNYLKCDAFTLNQPETIYLLGKQITWTNTDRIFDGNAASSGALFQNTTSPQLNSFAGASPGQNAQWALDTYAVVSVVFNGAASVIQVNNTAPIVGNAGASNMGGFTLGARASADQQWGHIRAAEAQIFSTAHDASARFRIVRYLSVMI